MKVFLSHISEEAPLGAVIKQWIQSTFLGQIDVFLSTDSTSLPPGSRWLDKIDQAMTEADMLLILASPQALKQPWINFEAGLGWAKRIDILPLCHSGQRRSKLPPPISEFQAVDLHNVASLKDFFQRLGEKVGATKLPRISYESFANEIEAAIVTGFRRKLQNYDGRSVEFIQKHAKLFQAEDLKAKIGEIKEDDEAVNGRCRFASLMGFRDHVVYGPYEVLNEPGDYIALFRIKIGEEYPEGPILLLDVFGDGEYANRIVSGEEFVQRARYQVFGLRFTTQGGKKKEYRVLPLLPVGKIWVDFVARARLSDLPAEE
jgi:TIR domain-containing protein